MSQSLKIQPRKALTTEPEELQQRLNDLVDAHIFQSSQISIESNFNGYLINSITIGPSSKVIIQHSLGVIPKWRIILRQEGNGVISDVPSEWTNRVIALKNNGSETVIISLIILRE